jgi:hypothetical protein
MPRRTKYRSKRHRSALTPAEREASARHILSRVSPYDHAALTAAIRIGHEAGLSEAEIARLTTATRDEVQDAIRGIARPEPEPPPF